MYHNDISLNIETDLSKLIDLRRQNINNPIIEYIKKLYNLNKIITKTLIDLEGKNSETICLEITLSKRKWCIVFAYRPPHNNNKHTFLVNCPIFKSDL